MTSKRKQFRAIFLAALMVLSVFAGTVAFAGSATAVDSEGDATVSPDAIESNTTQEHTLEVTFTNYTTDGQNDTFSASAPDGVTVESVDLSASADGSELNISSVGGGTWEIEDNGEINGTTDVTVTGDVTVTAPSVESDTEGEFEFTFEDTDGTNGAATAPVTITAAGDETATETENVEAQPQAVATGNAEVLSAVHYDNNVGSGVDPVVEVAFSESVDAANASEMTLYADGTPVNLTTDDLTVSGGQVVISTQDLNTGEVVLNVPDNVADVEGDNNVTVDVATASIANNTVSANVYQGETVAVLANNPNTDVEVEGEDSNYAFAGSTGENSQVFLFNTENRELDQYNFTIGAGGEASIELRDLGFNMTVDDQNVTTDDTLEGTVTANAGNRPIEVMLLDSDGDEVESIGATLSGQGEYDFDFNLSEVDAGEYTVEARDNRSGVTDTSSTINVAEAGEGTADFEQSIFTEARGDVATMNITVDNTDTATATIGSDDVGFLADVTVQDENDDGVVTLQFNTYAATNAGDASAVFSAEGDDEVTNANIEIGVNSLLEAGDYDVEVRSGTNADADSQNVATLVLEERETRALNTWTAPEGATFEDKQDVYEAAQNNNLTQAQEIALGDKVVQSVNASGLAGELEAQDNDEVSSALFDSSAVNFTVVQTAAETNRDPFMLQLNESNTDVIADAENDTYFVTYNPSEVNAYVDENENGEFDEGADTLANDRFGDEEALTANFTVSGDSELADEQQSLESDYELAAAEYNVEEPVNVTASTNQTIEGTTTVAPGTELQIRVRSSDDTTPSFLKTSTAYVTENRTFDTQFDFSEQSANDTFTVTVSGGPSTAETLEADGNIVAGGANETETVTAGNETETTMTEVTTEGGETTTAATTTEGGLTTTAAAETGDTGTETGTGTPGFGVVVALVALVAAAFLAVRRD